MSLKSFNSISVFSSIFMVGGRLKRSANNGTKVSPMAPAPRISSLSPSKPEVVDFLMNGLFPIKNIMWLTSEIVVSTPKIKKPLASTIKRVIEKSITKHRKRLGIIILFFELKHDVHRFIFKVGPAFVPIIDQYISLSSRCVIGTIL
jgi:hypothetical protein